MCATSVILRHAFPQVWDFRQRPLTGFLKQWNSNKHKRFVSRSVLDFVVEYWVYCTFVELKIENFIYKKSTDNEKTPAKLGIGETTKIMLIKYTGASVVNGVYGEQFASVLGDFMYWAS